jgi:hypothetical protein
MCLSVLASTSNTWTATAAREPHCSQQFCLTRLKPASQLVEQADPVWLSQPASQPARQPASQPASQQANKPLHVAHSSAIHAHNGACVTFDVQVNAVSPKKPASPKFNAAAAAPKRALLNMRYVDQVPADITRARASATCSGYDLVNSHCNLAARF